MLGKFFKISNFISKIEIFFQESHWLNWIQIFSYPLEVQYNPYNSVLTQSWKFKIINLIAFLLNYEKFIIISVNVLAPIHILRIFHAEYFARFLNFSRNVKYTSRVYFLLLQIKRPWGAVWEFLKSFGNQLKNFPRRFALNSAP